MKNILRSLSVLVILLGTASGSAALNGLSHAQVILTDDMPLKTVVIKDPAAEDQTKFFSMVTTLRFWIYKAGSSGDIDAIMKNLKNYSDVQSCTEGGVSGDYKEITVVVKSKHDKAWFTEMFRKAGLSSLKINNGPVTALAKS
jgi:hypothetical protein